MLIRKASGEEMLALWGYKSSSSVSPTARFFHENITSGKAVFWALDDGWELIGELYSFFELDDRDFADGESTAYLCAFRVKKEHRGKGCGTRLMTAVLAELKARGYRKATIGVSPDEPQNLRLYRRLGFTDKVKDCHYDPCAMDADMRPAYDEKGFALLAKTL